MRVSENGKEYDVLFLCGLTVSLYKLTNNERYPNIVADGSLQKLRGMHADVLLAAHGFWFDREGKAARQKDGEPNPFVDSTELDATSPRCRTTLSSPCKLRKNNDNRRETQCGVTRSEGRQSGLRAPLVSLASKKLPGLRALGAPQRRESSKGPWD
jgi:hypothetical protein